VGPRPDDILIAVRVGELGGCGLHLGASGTVEGDHPGDIAMLPSRRGNGVRLLKVAEHLGASAIDDLATLQRSRS
jgi:hypothetical protein